MNKNFDQWNDIKKDNFNKLQKLIDTPLKNKGKGSTQLRNIKNYNKIKWIMSR